MTCGAKILRLREQRGMTQQQLADKLQISRAALSHYENNRRNPSYGVLLKLAELFGVNLRFLLQDDSPVPGTEPAASLPAPKGRAGRPSADVDELYTIVHFHHQVHPSRML